MAKNCTLFALESGTVAITTEKMKLDPENAFVKKFFSHQLHAPAIYKRFMHIIADPIPSKFRLVDQV